MATWPTLKAGSTGENVRTLQYLLNHRGASLAVDGSFGAATKAALKSFQQSKGLTADGIAGDQTWTKLVVTVDAGDSGAAVRAVQRQVNLRLPGRLAVDGLFGAATTEHVEAFQRPLGLAVDGIVGPSTWNRFVNRCLVATTAENAAKRVFDAWKAGDAPTARKHATKAATDELFTIAWTPSTWTFEGSQGAAGTVYVSWGSSGGEMVLAVNNNTGAPYFWVREVTLP